MEQGDLLVEVKQLLTASLLFYLSFHLEHRHQAFLRPSWLLLVSFPHDFSSSAGLETVRDPSGMALAPLRLPQ